jgi:spore coat protein U-like protein
MLNTRTFAHGLAAVLAIAALPLAHGAGTHTVNVQAIVLANSNCRITTAGASLLDFGSIDPSSAAPATASVVLGYRCNGGSPIVTWGMGANDGLYATGPAQRRMRHAINVTRFLPYSLNVPMSGTAPRNTNQTLTLVGTVAVTDFQVAIAGMYNDTVVLTIAP